MQLQFIYPFVNCARVGHLVNVIAMVILNGLLELRLTLKHNFSQ